jgi:hypothetical protein
MVEGVDAGFGVGVEGPNNGEPQADQGAPGEIDFELQKPSDSDFSPIVASGGDATVLNFKITLA